MPEMTNLQWGLIIVAAILYVGLSARIARRMKRLGHNGVLWFFVSVLFTAIPASFVFLWHEFGHLFKPDRTPTNTRGPRR